MKKICIITTISTTMKSFVIETAKYLHNECGYDVTLICDNDEVFAKTLPEYLRYIPVAMSRGMNLSGFRAIKKFKEIFKKEKFDLVQYATPNAAFYASRAAKKEKVSIRLYCQWGIRYVGFSGIKRKIFKFLEKSVCKKSTHIFAVSPLNMQFAIKEKLYSKVKAQVVGNGGTIGVDMQKYDIEKKEEWRIKIRKKYNFEKEDFVFGFVGRVTADKGCGELLGAFKELSQRNRNAKLLIVGPMEKDCGLDKELLEWAQESQNVVLTGRVNEAEIKEYYAAMDMLVHPTYREGFGMVIQEAGALAVPVITTKIPGASEVMVDNESCLLVSAGNLKELEQVMETVVGDLKRVEALGKAAYERTKELYQRPIMLANQKQAYEKLLGE